MSEELHHVNYVKIWGILLVLLVISVAGPFLGIGWVTLVTAFGIAIVKAYLVAKNFMHLNIQPKYAVYLLTTMLVFMVLFFAGVAPDVMEHSGTNWTKPDWAAEMEEQATAPAPAPHS
jgi:caa(3)-type oxidase subunit IV